MATTPSFVSHLHRIDCGRFAVGEAIVRSVSRPSYLHKVSAGACAMTRLSADDKLAIRAYWSAHEPHRDAILADLRAAAAEHLDWQRIFETTRIGTRDQVRYELERAAILDDHWEPYIANLKVLGATFAQVGVGYSSWFELIRELRDATHRQLSSVAYQDYPATRALVSHGLNRFVDIQIENVGNAFVAAKEQLASGSPLVLAKPLTPSAPRIADARAIVPMDGHTIALPPELARTRVIIADDDADFRRVIGRMLRRAEFAVVEVDTGHKAIAEIERERFDVIISDVHMPDGDGIELMRAVRRVDLDVPVVLMSGEPDIASATSAVECGAFRYLTKPLDLDLLVKLVRHAASAHSLARLRREASTIGGAHAGAADRVGLEVRLDQALDRLWMAFQPIVTSSGEIFGVEALMRSGEPTMPGPQALLDAATQLGRLPQVGRRVRDLAAAALAQLPVRHAMFVNLHPEDLSDVELVAETGALQKLASRVILEITERASLEITPELSNRLARLRKLGFRLAVDDIGAGYSGLTTFTELMPEIVKIDMSLVRNIHASAVKTRTVDALCKLCHELGCLVVGEGVETAEERDCLVNLGCDLLQGFLLGRPVRELPTC